MSVAGEGTGSGGRLERSLASAGQLIAVAAILAPAVGVFIRFVAFFNDHDIRSAFMMAASLPLQELTAVGVESMIVPGIVLVLVLVMYVLYRPSQAGAGSVSRRLSRAEMVVFGCCIAVISASNPNFPGGLLSLVGGLVGGLLLGRSARIGDRRLSAKIAPAVTAFVAMSILSSGLTFKLSADLYHFASGSGVSDGSYVRLGESDGFTILRSCQELSPRIQAVPLAAISRIDLVPAPGTRDIHSLWDWLAHGDSPVVGVRYACP